MKDNTNPGAVKARMVGMEVSHMASMAVQQANVDVVAAYPITPQTHIVERLAEMCANGELDAEFVPVESEHSAMSVCVGAAAAGARTFTCTSAQGVILMSEIVYIANALRLPCLMILANRSLSGPLSIWCDHSDVMSIRDCGWIQVFAENGQEVYDLTFHGYKVAERSDVLLPYILNLDGFNVTHVVEPFLPVPQDVIDRYLPTYKPQFSLHPDRPVTMGAYGVPELYAETKKIMDTALRAAYPAIIEEWKNWGDLTGRYYHPIETYRAEDAEMVFLVQGSMAETVSVAVDSLRARGEKVGLVRPRLWRPFPFEDLRRALSGAKTVIVLDRCVSYGGPGGPLSSEVRAALYGQPNAPAIFEYIVGLAGRDVRVEDFVSIADGVARARTAPRQEDYVLFGVRE